MLGHKVTFHSIFVYNNSSDAGFFSLSVSFQEKNSNHMEPEGLRRCLEKGLTQEDMDVSTLATDHHLTIGKMMSDYPEVRI